MKRICFFLHSIKSAGGAERRIVEIANYLSEADSEFKVFLLTWDSNQEDSFYEISKKVKWLKLPYKKGLFNKFIRVVSLYSILKKNNIKNFIGFVMSGYKTIFISCYFAKVKIIVAERNSPSMYKINFNILSRFLIFFNLFFASKIVVQLEEYVKDYPYFLKKKIKIIENFINIKNKEKLLYKKRDDYFKILIISRLENKQKNINSFLFSIKKINENYLKKIKISIIGDGVDFKIINNTIIDLKLNNFVDIIKPLSSDISSYYLNADLFIIPSKWEGVSNSLLEAMSYGLPVIALKTCQGMNKFVINNFNGYLVENENELIIFQDLIKELIDNKVYLEKLGRNSIEVLKKLNMIDDKIKWRDLLNDT